MSIEENKSIIQRIWEEVLNEAKTENVNEFVTDDYVYHGPGGYEVKGTERLKKFITWLHTTFPSIHFTIDDLIAEGDKVVTFWTMKGTHKTNKQVKHRGIVISRFAGGKVVEDWEIIDRFTIALQVAPGWAKVMLSLIEKQMVKDRP